MDRKYWQGARFIASFFTIIGAIVGFILGMVLVTVWQNYQKETENINLEVNNLFAIYRASYNLEKEDGDEIRNRLKNITEKVIYDSWPRMKAGKEGLHIIESADNLYNYIGRFKPKNSFEESIMVLMNKNLEKAGELRRNRNLRVTQSMVPNTMWVVIFFGIIVLITCSFFFRISPFYIHLLLTGLHCVMVSVVLFLIISMMYPYTGGTSISPEPFKVLLYERIPSLDNIMSK